ncbi:MAG: hypothetical protein WC788_08330 [Candidatus Paceibacterota bacterium]|jgi:hypothetical protein
MIAEYFVNLPFGLIKGVLNFFYIWYVQGTIDFWNKEAAFLRGVERDVGFIVHIKHITEPLFGDYDLTGRAIGFFFRIGFILFGFLVTATSVVFVVCLYLVWIIVPPITFWMTFVNLYYLF